MSQRAGKEDVLSSWERPEDGIPGELVYGCWLFQLRKERYRSRVSGRSHDFFVVDLADGVHVIAVTPDDQIVCVRQFRAGSGLDSLETPGGLLEPEEDPITAGARELYEETGYAGDPGKLIGVLRPNPALLTMKISTVVIENARRVGEPEPDPGEELTLELIQAGDVERLIEEGRIDHAVCAAGLLQWLGTRRRARD